MYVFLVTFVCILLLLYNCSIICADIDQGKLDFAKELGADFGVNTKEKDLKQVT